MAAVEPILGSHLWAATRARNGAVIKDLRCGCRSIDGVLDSGLSYGDGGICCLSFEDGTSKLELIHSFLISHLLQHPQSRATVIDQDRQNVLPMFAAMKAWLGRQAHVNPNLPARDIDAEAQALLGRVDFSPVFDFNELLDALAELRVNLAPSSQETLGRQTPPKSTIPDSQMYEDEDEDLLAPEIFAPDPPHGTTTPDHDEKGTESGPQPHLLIISDLPTLFLPLQRANYIHASSLLSSLLRSIRHLCAQSRSACLLINGCTSPATPKPNVSNTSRPSNADAVHTANDTNDSPSIFTSCLIRPLFYRVLSPGVDVNVLIHLVPRGVEDARAVYGRSAAEYAATQTAAGEGNSRNHGGYGGLGDVGRGDERAVPQTYAPRRSRDARVRWVSCFETLGDRHGGRTGRFGFYVVDGRGMVRDGLG